MFAVIRSGGKQYRVAADDILKIEKLAGEAGEIVEIADVLMVGEGANTTIGTPVVKDALVTAEILEQGRAGKIIAFKKRRRQNSRRKIGHRQHLTTVRISEILTGGAKPSKKAAGKKAEPKKEETAKAAPKKEAVKKQAPKQETKAAASKKETGEKPAKKETATATLFKAPKGNPDKLTEIKGIGPVAEKQLNEQGITTYAQIAKLNDKDFARIDEAMPFSAEQITDWRDQAKKLAKS